MTRAHNDMSVRRGPAGVDPMLEEILRGAVAVGAVLLLLVPAARGHHAQLGWLPLWLLGMPMMAWWAAHRFRLPGWIGARRASLPAPRPAPRRHARQAERRARPVARRAVPRVAA
jgi:hypothetical protein